MNKYYANAFSKTTCLNVLIIAATAHGHNATVEYLIDAGPLIYKP